MRICLILEGSYPYVHGGVSTWMHQYIQNMPEHRFVLWVIGANGADRGKFVYDLPDNVDEIHEIFLDEALKGRGGRLRHRFSGTETAALEELVECGSPDWEVLFDLFQKQRVDPAAFLKSQIFLDILTEHCEVRHPNMAFADAFYTMRSMLLPLLYLLGATVPRAELYHSISTGYGGVLAALGSYIHHAPLLLTEHGIYTREREEEIIRAKWVLPAFKKQWIRFFYMLSDVIYTRASGVTGLFSNAMETQIEIGCARSKCRVIENGIDYDKFSRIPSKQNNGWIDIGAFVRFAPIKDIKTMLYAYYELGTRIDRVRLFVMGGVDDQDYAQECYDLVEQLHIKNVIFTGRVDVEEYMEKLDFTILTSLSEGQPLTVLESLAAGRPCVTTDVGCCRELLEGGKDDSFGAAGFCVPPMYREGLADAMEQMCRSKEMRTRMGENGRRRVDAFYRRENMVAGYQKLYKEVAGKWQELVLN